MEKRAQQEAKVPEVMEVPKGAIETHLASEAVIDVGDLTVLEPGQFTDASLKQLELRADYKAKVTAIALRQTSPSQWVKFQSEDGTLTLYPMGAAADAMFGVIGGSWRGIKDKEQLFDSERKTDSEGKVYFKIQAELVLQRQRIAGFVGKRYVGGFAASEADAELDGFENLKSRAARAVFGLAQRTIADIKAMSGLDLTGARGAQFESHKGRTDNAEGWTLPWGKSKGTKLSDATEKDIRYFIGAFEEDLKKAAAGDPKAKKYEEGTKKKLEAFNLELERRKKPPEGVAPAAATPAATPEQAKRVEELSRLISEEGAVLNIAEAKMKDGFDRAGNDVAKLEDWLKHLRDRRKKEESAAGEPGAAG